MSHAVPRGTAPPTAAGFAGGFAALVFGFQHVGLRTLGPQTGAARMLRPQSVSPPAIRPQSLDAGPIGSRTLGELREVWPTLLLVRVATLLRFLGHVEQQRRVTSELLDSRQAIVCGVVRGLQHPQCER